MTGPVFPTKWDFLHASVLIGVDRSTGVFSGSEPTPGQQMVCVWTSDEVATEALHVESWDLKQIKVRDLLALLPGGIGVIVDPERPSGMTATASYVANLKQLVPPFPPGSAIRLGEWSALTAEVRAAVVGAVSDLDLVRELHAFTYTIDDSPTLGCLAHVVKGAPEDTAAVVRDLDGALAASADLTALGVATVAVVSLDDVPQPVREALGGGHVIHRRHRSRPWRR